VSGVSDRTVSVSSVSEVADSSSIVTEQETLPPFTYPDGNFTPLDTISGLTVIVPDIAPSQTETAQLATVFTDPNSSHIETIQLATTFPDVSSGQTETAQLATTFSEVNATVPDTSSVNIVASDSTATPSDAQSTAFTFTEIIPGQQEFVLWLVTQMGGGGGGPNPLDAFSLDTIFTDNNSTGTDATSFAFTFPESIAAQIETALLSILGADSNTVPTDASTFLLNLLKADSNVVPTDAGTFLLNLLETDSNTIPTDAGTFLLNLLEADSNNTPTDTQAVNIVGADSNNAPTSVDTYHIFLLENDPNNTPGDNTTLAFTFPDSNSTPTDARTSASKFWLAGCTGSNATDVPNPGNANGPNDGTLSAQHTNTLGASTTTLTSGAYPSISATMPFTNAICRPYFSTSGTLVTSTWSITATWTGGSATITSGNGGTNVSHLSGDLTFDLFAAGMNTQAKLQSLVIKGNTSDSVAGLTPVTLNIDAIAIEVSGVL